MICFFKRTGVRPSVVLDTVAGDNCARAILPAPAVDESWLTAEERKDGTNLVRRRGRPRTQRHAHVVHTQSRDLLAFPRRIATVFSEIDHQFYALRTEFLEGGCWRVPHRGTNSRLLCQNSVPQRTAVRQPKPERMLSAAPREPQHYRGGGGFCRVAGGFWPLAGCWGLAPPTAPY